ncbi:hypothetical protein I5907_13385 [Panacibacter sp. DH6]|uniref:Uncharacterized protein n=2 Tax=Panacibacter microcysteis TaxID=2793269 RepID=A0A931EAH5_9BACT|nr:hypothetical protein [Panacibacter microcysteis]
MILLFCMKHSQLIGILAVLALIGICFMPFTFIASKQITVTGFSAEGTNFGKPGYLNVILSVICLIFFAVPKIWAKRTNVFIAAINLAWALRNYLLLGSCILGECPEKKAGLYLLMLAAIVIQAMTLLPKMDVMNEKS